MEEYVNLFVMKYGYAGIFLSLSLGVFGLPIPDEVLVTYVGYAAARGILSMPAAFASTCLGAGMGSVMSYAIGRKWALPLLDRAGPYLGITAEKRKRAQAQFARRGPILLFAGYFLPGLRFLTAYLAGAAGIGLRRFALYSVSGAIFWSMAYIQVGLALGKDWLRFAVHARHYGFWLLVMLTCIGAGVYILRKSGWEKP